MNLSSGKIWPYAISLSIIFVFGAGIATIIISMKLPVEMSDIYMMGYQKADKDANDIINARIAFDKKYKIEYLTKTITLKDSVFQYKVTDKNNNPVNNAVLKLVITRPNNHKNDQEVTNPTVKDGIYSFSNITLPLEGRWNIMAHIIVDENQRFYNIKADTRKKKFKEY